MFASCGSLIGAVQVFSKLLHRTVYTWNAIVSAHVNLGEARQVLRLLHLMLLDDVHPDEIMLSCLLKGCRCLNSSIACMLIHHYMMEMYIHCDIILSNTLLDAYAHCGCLCEAWILFSTCVSHDVVSWSSIITAHVNQGESTRALDLFVEMSKEAIQPDAVVFLSLLRASSSTGMIKYGRMLHDELLRNGFETSIPLGSSLVDMYAKCGSVSEAYKLFQTLPFPSLVSWSTMIAGFADHGPRVLAFKHFADMQERGIEADKSAFLSILKACSGGERMDVGSIIHTQIVESGLEGDSMIGSSITDMYAKNGYIEDAYKVFGSLLSKDEVIWGVIIRGYVQVGQADMALALFCRMLKDGVQPIVSTFLSGLRACADTGKVDEGMIIHDMIVRRAIESDASVGSSLVDMYAKYGDLDGSRKVFDTLPYANEVAYGAMIAGYVAHGEAIPALQLFDEMDTCSLKLDAIIFLYAIKACSSVRVIMYCRQMHHKLLVDGLEGDLRIGNCLTEMYINCRKLSEAQWVFDSMPKKDAISWGVLISGYAEIADSRTVKYQLNEMQSSGWRVNDMVFTSILAACSNACQVRAGCDFFTCMTIDYGIWPSIEHYTCMIDLLGRTGCFFEAQELIKTMPFMPNIITWTTLLSSCHAYCNCSLGQECFDRFIQTDPDDGSGYLLMLNTYAHLNMWYDFMEIQGLKCYSGAFKKPGKSSIEIDSGVHEFIVGTNDKFLSSKLQRLGCIGREEGFVPMLVLAVG
ncbi:hypothetical protein KP509_07G013700 [Ceratopteris richardii]|nr:hypothetical protein KP509_07G013700 [Ceratopteris richardii]